MSAVPELPLEMRCLKLLLPTFSSCYKLKGEKRVLILISNLVTTVKMPSLPFARGDLHFQRRVLERLR